MLGPENDKIFGEGRFNIGDGLVPPVEPAPEVTAEADMPASNTQDLGEAFMFKLSDEDLAIQDHEAMQIRFAQLREQRDTAQELGDTLVVEESLAIMDALSRLRGTLLE